MYCNKTNKSFVLCGVRGLDVVSELCGAPQKYPDGLMT